MITAPNLLANLPASLPQEFVELLLSSPNLRVERIISRGHASPENSWYDQDSGEWVLLLSGVTICPPE